MKRLVGTLVIFALLSGMAMAQTKPFNYEEQWKMVDKQKDAGLPKEALKIVSGIYTQAKLEQQHGHFLRSVIYRMGLTAMYEENSLEKALQTLDNELKTASEPQAQILHSAKAEVLWNYYQQNRYEFMDRTTTVKYDKEDIDTWDLRSIVELVFTEYQLSLRNEPLLMQTGLTKYDQILNKTDNGRPFRPTLYDFLAHRAIDFFMGDEPEIVKPALTFYLNNPQYLSAAAPFSAIPFTTPDSLSMKFFALKLLQQVVKFHLNDSDPTALINTDLKRLGFVRDNALFENVDSIYLASLLALYNQHSEQPEAASICFVIANHYRAMAEKYDSLTNPSVQFHYVEALRYANLAIKKFPETMGANNCKWLLHAITAPTLSITNESNNVPERPFRVLASYKNVSTIHVRVIPVNMKAFELEKTKTGSLDLIMKKLIAMPSLKEFSINLPGAVDYQQRSAEIMIPELGKGEYILLTSSSANFNLVKDKVSYTDVKVTDLCYIEQMYGDGSKKLAVADRKTGKPIENAMVEVRQRIYNSRDESYESVLLCAGKTDRDGHYLIPAVKRNENGRNLDFSISYKEDTIYSNGYYWQYYRDTTHNSSMQAQLFTDRAIYRPGQTIFFKGILVKYKGNASELLTGKTVTVELLDPNWQVKGSMYLTTNEYGSFHGSFVAPIGGITGEMQINCNSYGSVAIQVEEYKRPKFETTFHPVKGSYRLNEKVTVTGEAKAYAGNPIDGAMVKYRIIRQESYPWWCWWWGMQPSSSSMEILSGETVTDQNGQYSIVFEAIPDYTKRKELLPLFDYAISVDVTDINGETHSANTSVSVGYRSMFATISIPSKIEQSAPVSKYDLRTTNLNGELEPAAIAVKVSRLEQPSEILNTRLWGRPTSFVYSKAQFRTLFPYDEYDDELNINNWPKSEVVYEKTHHTATDTVLKFDNLTSWKCGNYCVEITGKDKDGLPFEKRENFVVVNSKSKENARYEHLEISASEKTTEPGKTVKLFFESRHTKANVFVEVFRGTTVLQKKWIVLDKNTKSINLPITEKDYGVLKVNAVLTINNKTYSESLGINVKQKNQRLDISFATFRDKLLPGQQEEWQITIKGCDGEKLAAELMATMYDASLDVFAEHYWSFYQRSKVEYTPWWNINSVTKYENSIAYYNNSNPYYPQDPYYESLNLFGFNLFGFNIYAKNSTLLKIVSNHVVLEDSNADMSIAVEAPEGEVTSIRSVSGDGAGAPAPSEAKKEKAEVVSDDKPIAPVVKSEPTTPPQVRTNFNETAFFMPQLATDSVGNVVLKFKVPESLTRWNIMGLAHTKDLRIGQFAKELVTQKELMVVPNQPRFFREGDQMSFTAKISNISATDLTGVANVEFFDALTLKSINRELGLTTSQIPFSALKGQSTSVAWNIAIPQGVMAITYRVTASAGTFSDGEEMTLPVLTNRMLVTESLPLPINGNQTKSFSFEKLKNSTSTTLKSFKYTLEFTSNPAWYAIQSLPYLMEYPYECSEQTFSRLYANSIATHIANSSPKIKAVFQSWKINTPEALVSNLEKNQELKSILLEETPWVMEAKSETEQKNRIGLLFDLINMSNQLEAALLKLQKSQSSSGGWPWFVGMPDNDYITQYIVTGFGHLNSLGVKSFEKNEKVAEMINSALNYIDNRMRENYEELKKTKANLNEDHLGGTEIQYLYARTFFLNELQISEANNEAYTYYLNQTKKFWLNKGVYFQGMIALVNHRSRDYATAKKIIASIKDRALYSEEMGMYWRNEGGGYNWYEAPIERQALLIEAFDLVNNDQESVEKMKIWLLKQKQTQNWGTTKSTAEACYALLLKGTNLLADDQLVEIKIGDKVVDPKKMDHVKVEAGTGYFKTAWNGAEITPDMGNITVAKTTAGVAWGSVYWQYFENLDKITPAVTPLSMKKELFVVRLTPTGEVLEPVKPGDKIKVGDKIRVRIVLRSDRDMEYVHMKDMRASAFEPISVLSQYKYQDGLGYYESTRDAATNFFFDYLSKGTYVFEYTMFATQKGNFSNGITTIQCMYAPEFSSHSEGVRVTVE